MSYLLRVIAIAAALAVLAGVLAILLWPQGDSAVNSVREPAAVPAGVRAADSSPAASNAVAPSPPPPQSPSSPTTPLVAASAAAQPADPFKAFIEQAERAKADAAKSPFGKP